MDILSAIRAIAALPSALSELAKQVGALNGALRKVEAERRLGEKRDRNRDAVDSVLRGDAAHGQRGKADRTPTISGGSEGGTGTDN